MAQKKISPYVSLMAARGLTQEELAEILGVSSTTLRNWIKGRTTPSLTLEQWKTLSRVLKVPMNELPSWEPRTID